MRFVLTLPFWEFLWRAFRSQVIEVYLVHLILAQKRKLNWICQWFEFWYTLSEANHNIRLDSCKIHNKHTLKKWIKNWKLIKVVHKYHKDSSQHRNRKHFSIIITTQVRAYVFPGSYHPLLLFYLNISRLSLTLAPTTLVTLVFQIEFKNSTLISLVS